MKTFTIEAQFIFTGTISIPAENEDAAREMIECGNIGLCIGGDIQCIDDTMNWEFDPHADLQLYEVLS